MLTMHISTVEMKATGKKITSEHFNTAGRNVGAGLTAAVIVSQWTWAATLLQSSNVGWNWRSISLRYLRRHESTGAE